VRHPAKMFLSFLIIIPLFIRRCVLKSETAIFALVLSVRRVNCRVSGLAANCQLRFEHGDNGEKV
jgi:hypothetical protein